MFPFVPGTLSQKREDKSQQNTIQVRWGKLKIRTLVLEVANGQSVDEVLVKVDDQAMKATINQTGSKVIVTLENETVLETGQTLRYSIN